MFETYYASKEVNSMATHQEAMDAANKKPANRTPHEQGLVDRHSNSQAVRNADHAARGQQKIHGK